VKSTLDVLYYNIKDKKTDENKFVSYCVTCP